MELPERYWSTEEQRWIYPGDLPPLPTPELACWYGPSSEFYEEPMFDADQMRAYALEAVRAERERVSAKLDEFDAWLKSTDDDPAGWAVRQRFNELAAAIRAQGSKT